MAVMVVGESLFSFWHTTTISDRQLMAGDIVSTRQRLLAYKRREQRQMMVKVPLIVLWLIVAGILYLREMRSLNRAVRQIDEFTKG